MPERCYADVEYKMVYQGSGYRLDEFGRRIETTRGGGIDSHDVVADTKFEARINCGVCTFRTAKVVAEGKTKRDALERVRGKVRRFLLNRCESGKNL